MRLTFALLGYELDLTIGPAAVEEPDPLRDLGATGSTPAGFTATYDVPDDVPLPMRNNGWGDDGNRA